MTSKLLIATHNKNKFEEISMFFVGLSMEIISLNDLGINTTVDETGNTFAENAALKANAYSKESGLLTLADDSGLEVSALGGEPGIYSARYAGENASDEDRTALLLTKLKHIPSNLRVCRFRCELAVSLPSGLVNGFTGECQGRVTLKPLGSNGFGYDPVFLIPELGKTMAQLSSEQKNVISHRGKACLNARASFLEGNNKEGLYD